MEEKKEVSEKKEKPEQPHQRLINRYLELQGVNRADKALVNDAYRRYGKAAVMLLNALNHDATQAITVMERLAAAYASKGLSWKLETVGNHLPEFLTDRSPSTTHKGLQALQRVDAQVRQQRGAIHVDVE